MRTLGIGVIGFGFMGKTHTYGYRNIPLYYDPAPARLKLVGVADIVPERAQQAAELGGFEFGTTDWRELIARDDIDVISICSPNSQHAEQLLAAIAAGKHIYCDKPLVVTAEDIDRVERALKDYRGVGQVAMQYHFYPATLRARQLIEEGFPGNIISFRGAYLHSGSVDPHKPMGWKQLKSEGGGVLQDLGSHIFELLDYLIGPISEVMTETRILYLERPNGRGEIVPVEADDQMVMLAKLANGAVGVIEASKIATGTEDELRFEIHGDKGALRFNNMDLNYLEAYDLRDAEEPCGGMRGWTKISCVRKYGKHAQFPVPKFSIGWTRGHMHCLYSFLDAVVNGTPTCPSLQRGLQIQRMLAVAERSVVSRSWETMNTVAVK